MNYVVEVQRIEPVSCDIETREPRWQSRQSHCSASSASGILNVGGLRDVVFSIVAAVRADDDGRFGANFERVELSSHLSLSPTHPEYEF